MYKILYNRSMGSYEMVIFCEKRKEIVRYLGILGISIYSCEVHGIFNFK